MNDTRKWLTVLTIACSIAALSPACATLPDITQGTCGNKVLDPHEDCDTFPNDATGALTCGSPGSVNECRFEATDVSACPQKKTPAYVLGVDGVCRQPSNRFREGLHLPSIQGVRLTASEFDGDGIADLFVVPADHSRREIAYMNELGVSESLFASAGPLLSVTPGSLDGDTNGTTDLVIPAAGGIAALLGLTSRGFSPKLYSPVPSSRSHTLGVPISILGQNGGFETAGLVRPSIGGKVGLCFGLDCTDPELIPLEDLKMSDFDPEKVITVFGDLDGPTKFPLLAYGRAESNVVRVVRITAAGNPATHAPPSVEVLGLTLPSDRFLGPTIALSDANGDGALDLITSAVSKDGFHSQLLVALGPATSWTTGMPLTNAGSDLFGARLLGAGHINEDLAADYVLDRAVLLSDAGTPGGYQKSAGSADQTAWREAVVGDLNGDGLDDAVMASGSAGLDLLLGNKGLKATRGRLPAPAGMKTLEIGDLDGDGSKDVIASTIDHPDCDADQQLVAYYGRSLAAPEGPFLVAEAPAIREVTPLFFGDPLSGLGDGMEDLIVLYGQAKDGHCVKAVDQGGLVFGAADRQPLSPFVTNDGKMNLAQPFLAAVGDATADGIADIASLVIVPNNDNNDQTLDLGLAFARGIGGGDLEIPTKFPAVVDLPNHPDFLPSSTALAIGGPGPGGIADVLVAMPRYADCTTTCRLAVDAAFYRFEGGAFSGHDIPLPGGDTLHTEVDRNDFLEPPRVIVGDVDGDGDQDFVVSFVFQEKKGEAPSPSAAFIFRNEQGSYIPERIESPDSSPIVDVAIAKDAIGVRPHLLAATRRGVYAIEGKDRRLLFRVRANDKTSSSNGAGGGGVAAPPAPDQRIISITTGDVTGDQLEDVVILTDEGAIIYEQLAAIVSDDGPLFSLNPADRL